MKTRHLQVGDVIIWSHVLAPNREFAITRIVGDQAYSKEARPLFWKVYPDGQVYEHRRRKTTNVYRLKTLDKL